MIRAVAAGQSPTGFDLAKLDEMNAQHARDLITLGLLDHIDEHFGSIRRTVGLPDGGKGR